MSAADVVRENWASFPDPADADGTTIRAACRLQCDVRGYATDYAVITLNRLYVRWMQRALYTSSTFHHLDSSFKYIDYECNVLEVTGIVGQLFKCDLGDDVVAPFPRGPVEKKAALHRLRIGEWVNLPAGPSLNPHGLITHVSARVTAASVMYIGYAPDLANEYVYTPQIYWSDIERFAWLLGLTRCPTDMDGTKADGRCDRTIMLDTEQNP